MKLTRIHIHEKRYGDRMQAGSVRPAAARDIDVFFSGTLTPYRRDTLKRLEVCGRVQADGLTGEAERNAEAAREMVGDYLRMHGFSVSLCDGGANLGIPSHGSTFLLRLVGLDHRHPNRKVLSRSPCNLPT